MNIFLTGLGLSDSMKEAATQALESITSVYPQLDRATLGIWNQRNVFLGTMHTNPAIAAPREYIAKSGKVVTVFTGTPISSDGTIVPHRAADLGRHWDQLPKKLDGQFAAVKVDLKNLQLEVLTDPLGMEQVYMYHRGSTVVVSNSVRLIEQTCGLTAIDEIGVSLFLSLGWVGGHRTLRKSVQVLPGGYLHRWKSSGSCMSVAYFSRSSLARLSRTHEALQVHELAEDFTSMVRSLSHRVAPLGCSLTGGRDSRVVAAAVIASGAPASFVTTGTKESADVTIATKIAETLHLPHHIGYPQGTVTDQWDEGARRLVRQTDGMVNLWQIHNVISQRQHIDSLPLSLQGVGGEIGSGAYYRSLNLPPTLGGSQMVRTFLSSLVAQDPELLTKETGALSQQSVRETCYSFLDDGFEPQAVPDAFYAFDRVRRWAGANTRKTAPICDPFTPFCTKPYIKAAHCVPLPDRIAGHLHRELIRTTTPSLLDIPYDKPWRYPSPTLGRTRVIAQTVREAAPRWLLKSLRYGTKHLHKSKANAKPAPIQVEWVEAKRESIADICLNQRSSMLWDYIDRRSFERIMSSTASDTFRRQHCARILSIATLFYYEADRLAQ
ncbi:MAG: asparagine synthase-related protein [Nitrospira sp.]